MEQPNEIDQKLKALIRNIPDFPSPGINFKDITTLLVNPEGLKLTISELAKNYREEKIDFIAGMEARGFVVGTPLAVELGVGFLMLRKPFKLPGEKFSVQYGKEYGKDILELSAGIFPQGSRVLIVDDLLATGGTALGACELVKKAGGTVVGCGFVIDLAFLPGRTKLQEQGYKVFSLCSYKE